MIKTRIQVLLIVPLLFVALVAGCTSKSKSTGGGITASSPPLGTSTSQSATSSTACPTSNTTSFAKTKFVLHAGLAFGAFHRYIYKPLKAGTFTSGSKLSKVKVFAKAGLAALFIKREVRLTYEDAKANPTLCKVIATPLQAIGNTISDAVARLKGGDTSGITAVESSVQAVESKASSTGAAIQEDANAPLS